MKQIVQNKTVNFQSLTKSVGKFNLKNKICLIPEMNRIGSYLLAATFRGFGINARVMDTYKGLELGNEYTSGKECYPCQITTGDILYFIKKEKEKLGGRFNPGDYVYFMPEADGPCRFGMYNKYQRIVLDSIDGLDKLKIASLSTQDGYSLDGIIGKAQVKDLRKASYFSVVVADILDRLLWRIRPYEKVPGTTDRFIEKFMHIMGSAFETLGPVKKFDMIIDKIEEIIEQGKTIIDTDIPSKPLIGIVGEIYLRSHVHANQDLIRILESYGAEVVNASIAEWVNYTSYGNLRAAVTGLKMNLRQLRPGQVKKYLKKMISFKGDLFYQEYRQKQVYKRVTSVIDLAEDHKVANLEKILTQKDLLTFDIGTEACLSIPGVLKYIQDGFNGVVNVYPFTCMPSTITSAVVKPLMNKVGIPYLDTPYDESLQPGREAALRTFMYQAQNHFKRYGRKNIRNRSRV